MKKGSTPPPVKVVFPSNLPSPEMSPPFSLPPVTFVLLLLPQVMPTLGCEAVPTPASSDSQSLCRG